jgi:uncharacterized protein (DUF2336 family)
MREEIAKARIELADLNEIVTLAHDKSPEARARLASALSTLFAQPLNLTETALVGDILLTLLQKAERDLREILSERLALYDHVPRDLILSLAHDEIAVAQFVLEKSKVLNDHDLLTLINAKSAEYWAVIAQRNGVSTVVIDRLINTGHLNSILVLLKNESVFLQAHSIKNIIRLSVLAESLHEPLLKRQELNTELASYLYMAVSQKMRDDIRKRFGIDGFQAERALDFLDHEMQAAIKGKHEVTEDLRLIANRFQERKQITADFLIKTLRRNQYGFFIALVSAWSEVSNQYVTEIITQEDGKTLAALMRYLKVQKTEFASIFLLSRAMGEHITTIHNDKLVKALAVFDSLQADDIAKIMARLRQS